eukprot:12428685-Karenia_brevis.AAC.1
MSCLQIKCFVRGSIASPQTSKNVSSATNFRTSSSLHSLHVHWIMVSSLHVPLKSATKEDHARAMGEQKERTSWRQLEA